MVSQPAEPTCLAISALTINIPEPIIDPTTSMVPSSNPSSLLKSSGLLSSILVSFGFWLAKDILFWEILEKQRKR
jgi:hypothetical protein